MRPSAPKRVFGVLLLSLVTLVSSVYLRPAGATEPIALRLVDQAPWVPMGFDAGFTVTASAPARSTLILTVHRVLTSRDELLSGLAGELGPVLGRTRTALPAGAASGAPVDVGIGTQDPDGPRDNDRVELERSGVYPVRIALETPDGEVSAEIITHMIAVDATSAPVPTVPVAVVVGVQSAPLRLPDDTPDPDVIDELRPGGRLDRIATELAEAAGISLSIVLGGETVQEWEHLAATDDRVAPGLEALRAAVDRAEREIVAAPYVRLDLPALRARDLADEIAPQLRAGAEALSATLGVRVDPRLLVADPVDPASIELLATESFVDRLVLSSALIESDDDEIAHGGKVALEVAGATIDVAVTDDAALFISAAPGSTAQRVHRLTAALAMSAFDGGGGSAIAFPHDWNPDEGYLSSLLAALEQIPLLEPVTLDDWFTSGPVAVDEAGEQRTVEIRSIDVGTPAVTRTELARARAELATLEALLGGDDARVHRGRQAILRAPSASFSGSEGRIRATSDLEAITNDATTFLSGVRVDEKAVTLTGQRATIPLTFHNETDRPVNVSLRFESPKLVFPDGEAQTLELPVGISNESVEVQARTSGSFAMTVTMTTLDGVFPIGEPARITIRTTIFGGLGGWIAAAAALFLGAWWLAHSLRSRRHRVEGAL